MGGQVRPNLALYFFYPQADRLAILATLRNILIAAAVVLAALGAFVGYWLARRLLGPIQEASAAAADMAEGNLNIRLPVGPDEFGQLATSFNRMAENLQAKLAALEASQARERRFVADVAHELRTPVSALVGEASLLKAKLETAGGTCPPEITRLAAMVTGDIARLRQLVDDLLEISRLDARAAEVTLETVDLVELSAQVVRAHNWSAVVRMLSPASSPATDATLDVPRETLRQSFLVRTDKRRVERILVNLIENALRHGAPPVVLTLERTPNSVALTVRDHGPGIRPEHLPHIFERFYKADPSRASGPGSGLGLAIAWENARLLGGNLEAGNAPGGGAYFLLTLPL
ncbi:MAG: HAMP domain-containing histidine kinase [Thermoleophilia bacterium]|nr:HAMP domain-containing histidine kinase [Thermoleophilia bacterium]